MENIITNQAAHPGDQALVILDDIVGIADTKGAIWRRLGAASRTHHITFIVVYQSLARVETVWRDSARNMFCLNIGGQSREIMAGIADVSKSDLSNTLQMAWADDKYNVIRYHMVAGGGPKIFKSSKAPDFWVRYVHPT